MTSKMLRSLQGLLAVSSFFLLTGAKGQGCGGTVVLAEPPAQDPPSPIACGAGSHLETLCDGGPVGVAESGSPVPSPDGACHDECVPDGQCPAGTSEQWVCEAYAEAGSGGSTGGGGSVPFCGEPECPPPPCYLTCVPSACPPGSHAEVQCGGGGTGGGAPGVYAGAPSPAPTEPPLPGECTSVCVADQCPPGSISETHCENACDGMEQCWTECVPFGAPKQ